MFHRTKRALFLLSWSLALQLHAQTGPAGVGANSTNVLWLSADRGPCSNAGTTAAVNNDNVQQWNDRSGNGKNATQATAAKRPDLITGAVNGYPALKFRQANSDHMTTVGLTTANQASVWVVARYATLPSTNPGLIQGGITGNALASDPTLKNLGMWVQNTGPVWGRGIQSDGTTKNVPATTNLVANTWYVLNSNYDGTSITQYVNNSAAGTIGYNGTLRSWTDVAVGVQAGSEFWNGDIAEVIMYNTALNATQRIIVGNYLAAKYGTTLGANDLYINDNANKGNFDHEMAGIGQMAPTDFQKDSRGSSVVRISAPTNLDNGEFMFWGHNNGALGTFGIGDRPAGVQGRWGRTWRVSEVNTSGTAVDVGAVDLVFDLNGLGSVTASDLRLIVDTDKDSTFADETAISGATGLGGGLFKFAGVTALANGTMFTLGTSSITNTPLPIQLLSFTATAEADNSVHLEWTTASEEDNDHFTVERTDGTSEWEAVAVVSGAGTSAGLLDYGIHDTDVPQQELYYRLRQTDLDGASTISDIRYVDMRNTATKDLLLYPNPVVDRVSVRYASRTPFNFTIVDAMGREAGRQDRAGGDVPFSFDVSALPPGLYHVRIQRGDRVDTMPLEVQR